MEGISAAVKKEEQGTVYIFGSGADTKVYCKWWMEKDKLGDTHEYPSPIGLRWPNLPVKFQSGIQAALYHGIGTGIVFLFKGAEYEGFNFFAETGMPGYPKPIKGNWGLPESFTSDLDAAFNTETGKAYFFKGDQYLQYDMTTNTTDPGYPKPICGNWQGFPINFTTNIDAALRWKSNSTKVFFFKGREYIRYDLAEGKVDPDYPRSTAADWTGVMKPE